MGLHQSKIGLKSISGFDWSGKDVLDIGCGDGKLALDVLQAKRCRRIFGIDYDENEIKKAKRIAKKSGGGKLSFRQGNACHLNFVPNNSFDIVFCNIAFQQFEDKFRALKEIFRVLKPRGRVIMNFIPEKSDVRKEMEKLTSQPPFNRIIAPSKKGNKISKDEFEIIATKAGFKIASSVVRNDTLYYPNVDALLEGYQNFNVTFRQLNNLSKELRDIFWRQLRASFENRKTKQGYGETWKVVFARLQKP